MERMIKCMSLALLVLLALPALAQDQATVREHVEGLSAAGKVANKAYAPYRRGLPDERTEWQGIADLYKAVGQVADAADKLLADARSLEQQDDFSLAESTRIFRQRMARADSLTSAAHDLAATSWDAGLSDDLEEAMHQAYTRVKMAKQLADYTQAAGNDVAYAVGVTEGIGPRSLALSVVGILVVFGVLAMIALVVGAIRKMDDGWKEQEQVKEAEALEKQPTIDDTTAVLIAAACATVITGRFRVRRIRRLLSPRTRRTPWSAQGRLILQGSHSVTRKS